MTSSSRESGSARPSHGRDGRLRRWARSVLAPFWVVPSLWCLAAVTAGLLVPGLEQRHQPGWIPLLFEGGSDGARSLLSTIAGAMISVTGLVFSITIVVLQLASSQFSPRVLRTFLDDRVPQHALGVFAASFLYALTVLRSVTDGGTTDAGSVPQVAISLAYVLVLASVAMFLLFIHHITLSISVGHVIAQISAETRAVLERDAGRRHALPSERPSLPPVDAQRVVVATRSGILDVVDHALLLRAAERSDVRLEVLHRLGTFVPEGSPLATVHTDHPDTDWEVVVGRGLQLGRERSMQQDVGFGLRQLVDIAERALSPGINDPTTAVQVMDQLHDLVRRLGSEADRYGVHRDQDDVVRLITTEWSFSELLDLAVDEIAHWGAGSLQIPVRLDELFTDLLVGVHPAHRATVQAKRQAVDQVLAARA